MPFDGSDSSRFQPSDPAPLGVRAKLTRLVCALPGAPRGRWVQALFPGQADRAAEVQTACLLRVARAVIEAEEAWTRGAYRTNDGKHCAVGALRSAAARGLHGRGVRRAAHGALLAAARERGFGRIELMNDKSTHAEVLAAFDAAILSAAKAE